MRIFFFNIEKSILSWLNLWLGRIDCFIIDRIFAINRKLKTNDLGNLSAKAVDLMEAARIHSENLAFEPDHRDFIYYHYLTKYYTAVFESYFGTIPPIQVFNESRMALDHLVRAREKEEDRAENIGKATDHALRALLDLLKLNCVGLKEKIQKEHNRYPSNALGLVSDGDYIKRFAELRNNAEKCMFEAKFSDYNLEVSGCKKKEVANKFIHAFDAHNEWLQFQHEYRGKIIVGCTKYHILRAGSFLFVIISGIVVCYISSEITEWIKHLFAKIAVSP